MSDQAKIATLLRSLSGREWLLGTAATIGAAGLLYFSLRGARLTGIWDLVKSLSPVEISMILAVDAVIHVLFGVRWWMLVRVENPGASLFEAVGLRLSAFGLSYFTAGPQVGGEPLQVLHLRRRYASNFARATATVVLDKLLELLANFVFLMLGLASLLRAGILASADTSATVVLLAVLAVASFPLVHVLLLRNNHHPLSAMARLLPGLGRSNSKARRYVRVSERLVGRFCRRKPDILAAVFAVSLGADLLAVIEYALITSSLNIVLTPWQTLSAWTAGWLSFLVPVPAGLGALEASQVIALGAFGAAASAAIAVSLLMRARDVLFGGAGIVLAWSQWRLLAPARS